MDQNNIFVETRLCHSFESQKSALMKDMGEIIRGMNPHFLWTGKLNESQSSLPQTLL